MARNPTSDPREAADDDHWPSIDAGSDLREKSAGGGGGSSGIGLSSGIGGDSPARNLAFHHEQTSIAEVVNSPSGSQQSTPARSGRRGHGLETGTGKRTSPGIQEAFGHDNCSLYITPDTGHTGGCSNFRSRWEPCDRAREAEDEELWGRIRRQRASRSATHHGSSSPDRARDGARNKIRGRTIIRGRHRNVRHGPILGQGYRHTLPSHTTEEWLAVQKAARVLGVDSLEERDVESYRQASRVKAERILGVDYPREARELRQDAVETHRRWAPPRSSASKPERVLGIQGISEQQLQNVRHLPSHRRSSSVPGHRWKKRLVDEIISKSPQQGSRIWQGSAWEVEGDGERYNPSTNSSATLATATCSSVSDRMVRDFDSRKISAVAACANIAGVSSPSRAELSTNECNTTPLRLRIEESSDSDGIFTSDDVSGVKNVLQRWSPFSPLRRQAYAPSSAPYSLPPPGAPGSRPSPPGPLACISSPPASPVGEIRQSPQEEGLPATLSRTPVQEPASDLQVGGDAVGLVLKNDGDEGWRAAGAVASTLASPKAIVWSTETTAAVPSSTRNGAPQTQAMFDGTQTAALPPTPEPPRIVLGAEWGLVRSTIRSSRRKIRKRILEGVFLKHPDTLFPTTTFMPVDGSTEVAGALKRNDAERMGAEQVATPSTAVPAETTRRRARTCIFSSESPLSSPPATLAALGEARAVRTNSASWESTCGGERDGGEPAMEIAAVGRQPSSPTYSRSPMNSPPATLAALGKAGPVGGQSVPRVTVYDRDEGSEHRVVEPTSPGEMMSASAVFLTRSPTTSPPATLAALGKADSINSQGHSSPWVTIGGRGEREGCHMVSGRLGSVGCHGSEEMAREDLLDVISDGTDHTLLEPASARPAVALVGGELRQDPQESSNGNFDTTDQDSQEGED